MSDARLGSGIPGGLRERFLAQVGRNWWLLALRGLAAILFGILAFAWPGIVLITLIYLWGAYAIVDGLAASVVGFKERWWAMVAVGLIGVVAGVATFVWPGITGMILLYVIAASAIVQGIFQIVAGIQLRKEIEGEIFLILGGLAAIAFGFLLIARPGTGALSVIWLIGSFAIALGVLALVVAFRLRGFVQRTVTPAA